MKFTKMHGAGNDYVLLNCMEWFPDNVSALAQKVSNRHFGVGSDGLICICPSESADFRMRMFNADGSEGAMCGNGIRCAAKYVFQKNLTDSKVIFFETLSGIRRTELKVQDGEITAVSVDMGTVKIGEIIDIGVKGIKLTGVATWVGNPHFVVPVESLSSTDLSAVEQELKAEKVFPDGVNIELVKLLCRGQIEVRVWERGSGETMACGTGACAAAAVMAAMGRTEQCVSVQMPGGVLEVTLDKRKHSAFLQGPAEIVFEGELTAND